MNCLCTVNGREFEWSETPRSAEFVPLLHPAYGISEADVLRIREVRSGFDIAIRIDSHIYEGNVLRRYLGPLLVLGNAFPNSENAVTPGVLLRIRPKL